VWGGFVARDWAKAIGGGAINVVHKKPRTVGRFWSPPYDKEPLIHEVAMTSCMSFTAEPMFLPGEATVKGPLEKAGFKPEEYKQCLMDGPKTSKERSSTGSRSARNRSSCIRTSPVSRRSLMRSSRSGRQSWKVNEGIDSGVEEKNSRRRDGFFATDIRHA